VFIWYSHPLFCSAIEALLRRQGMECAGAASGSEDAVVAISRAHPDVVVADPVVEREHPLAIAEIIRICEPIRVLVLDPLEDEMRLYDGRGCGAARLETVVRAIEEAAGRAQAPASG
jgi:DNA-binding NarL/FixJ family response regulator